MESSQGDIRKELESRIMTTQKEISTLQVERAKIDEKLKDTESKLTALRTVYEIEARRFGQPTAPLFAEKGIPYRFSGMKLTEALGLLQKEQPEITNKQAVKILEREGFDFRSKRHLSAVHFASVALKRRKK